jgi:hypothetical protein
VAEAERPAGPAGKSEPVLPPEQRRLDAELQHVQRRIDGLRARMRAAVDLLGVLLLGLSGAALLVVTVLAVVGFSGDDPGVGLLFSSLAIICLPLVAFAGWRAFRPLWLLSRELNTLRTREQQLLSQLAPPVTTPVRGAAGGGARPVGGKRAPAVDPRLPPGRSPTGFREPQKQSVKTVLATRRVGWRVVVVIGIFMLMFAAGVIAGVLARG